MNETEKLHIVQFMSNVHVLKIQQDYKKASGNSNPDLKTEQGVSGKHICSTC